jgi:hypothetical protein
MEKTLNTMTPTELIPQLVYFGFTVKRPSPGCYHAWNKKHKFIIQPYDFGKGEIWSIGETSNYRLYKYDIKMPVPITRQNINRLKIG